MGCFKSIFYKEMDETQQLLYKLESNNFGKMKN